MLGKNTFPPSINFSSAWLEMVLGCKTQTSVSLTELSLCYTLCEYLCFGMPLTIYCDVRLCPVGGNTVPLEPEAGCVCEAGA